MSRQTVQLVGAIALLGALLTALLAFWPVHAAGVTCGNAVHRSDAADVADLLGTMTGASQVTGLTPAEDACSSATSSRRLQAGVLLAITLVAGGVAIRNRPSLSEPAAA